MDRREEAPAARDCQLNRLAVARALKQLLRPPKGFKITRLESTPIFSFRNHTQSSDSTWPSKQFSASSSARGFAKLAPVASRAASTLYCTLDKRLYCEPTTWMSRKCTAALTGQKHDEAVDADAQPRRGGHAALQGVQEIFVDVTSFFVSGRLWRKVARSSVT